VREELRGDIQQAPEGFKAERFSLEGVRGKVVVALDTMIIVNTLMGDIVVRLPERGLVAPGRRVSLRPTGGGSVIVRMEPRTSPSHSVGMDQARVVSAAGYRKRNPAKPDPIAGHAAAADAVLENVSRNSGKEDAFPLARALSLLPDIAPGRSASVLLAYLFLNFARGNASTWLGSAKQIPELWSTLFRETSVEIPGMGKWSVRQFPVLAEDGNVWGLFAMPAEPGKVSRFIVEIPTTRLGLVQIKAYGSESHFEIVVNSANEPGDDQIRGIEQAIRDVSDEDSITVKVLSDKSMIADLSNARRISMEA